MSDNGNGTSIITKPGGGGAIAGMGEKFSPDLFTGTGNFSVPIALPPGRNGFQPDITLVYSSGNGSGVFGLGWNLSIPGVARKTSKGIPLYDDDKDVFILSGAEDLVEITREPLEGGGYKARYQPRTEGLFAIIERYKNTTNDYWKVWSKDGLISYYGTPERANTIDSYNDPAVSADPQYRTKIFQWYLTQTVDVFGNIIQYSYTRDNRAAEASSDDPHDYDQVYLDKIEYTDYMEDDVRKFLCSVQIQYETRPDPISVYKQGFEMRTTKRATKIQAYTHAGDSDTKVKTYHFTYVDQRVAAKELPAGRLPLNGVSMLSQVKIEGHEGETSEWMPPLEFGYSGFEPQHRNFDPIQGEDMPAVSLASRDYEMADIFGTGLPDIIQLNGVARYWRNLGEGKYDMPRMFKEIPAGAKLADPQIQLIDANGDGRLDLLYNKPGVNGYYSMKHDGLWDHDTFTKHKSTPSFSLSDPEVKLLDLDGDGITDVLRNGSRLECFLNDPVFGFYKTITVEKKRIKNFPNISFADPRIKFADMCGDGLQDIVLIHDGNITYWPNLGYGNWGASVRMTKSPRFPYQFNPAQILLSDVDGDGCSDLVYVENNQVTLWINQSGESWSEPIVIQGTPPVSDPKALRFTDVKGTGIAGLLWSYDYTTSPGRQRMFLLDFTQGIKPYVLNEMNNHMGAITRVEYKPSTYYYLKDQQRGKPDPWPGNELGVLPNGKRTRWKTTLPFPVQVVSRVEVTDELSQGKLVTEYSYHHGYWDGGEREFRGFGRVHQRDTESFARFTQDSGLKTQYYSAPTETISWFHLGPIGAERGDWQEVYFEDEYWSEDRQVLKRPAEMISLINSLPRRARRDAYRTLRGSSLRTELYALDSDPNQKRPYTVTENLQGVRLEFSYTQSSDDNSTSNIQHSTFPWGPEENNKQGSGYIFFAQALASRSTQWERGTDPMTSFSFTEDYDQYGNPQTQIAIAVPRGKDPLTGKALRISPPLEGAGGGYLTTMSKTRFAHNTVDRYLIGRAIETKSYEVENDGTTSVFALKDQILKNTTTKKLLSHSLTYYDGEAFEGLAHGALGNYGVPVRTETLVMTQENVDDIYDTTPVYLQDSETPGTPSWTGEYPAGFRTALPLNAGYKYYTGSDNLHLTGYYCVADRKKFDFHVSAPAAKGLMLESKDPLDHTTTVAYDEYKLFPLTVTDPLGMVTEADYDYRVMQASQITDPNGNRAQFAFSPLGFLTKTYVLGKTGETVGDTDPEKPGTLMEYDFFAFLHRRQPVYVKTTVREHHAADAVNNHTIVSVQYSDGFGRLLQTRTQAEETIFGKNNVGASGLLEDGSDGPATGTTNLETSVDMVNVIVSGWQVYNNKGKVVEKYEPYYDKGFGYFPAFTPRKSRSYLNFTANGDVRFPDATQYDFGTGDFTIEAWVRCGGDGYDTNVSNMGSRGFDFYIYQQKLVLLLLDSGGYAQARSVAELTLNRWHHIAVVRIGNDPSNFLFYIDGEEIASEQWGYSPLSNGDISGSSADLTIGSYASGLDYYRGMMRNVRLYNRRLSASELAGNYLSGVDGTPFDWEELVLYAPLDEGSGTTIRDLSYYKAIGTLTGTGLEWTALASGYPVQGENFLAFTASGEVKFPDISPYHFGTGSFTIEAWVYCEGDGYDTVVSNMGGTGFDFYLYQQKLYLYLSDGSSYAQSRTVETCSLNTWHHVAVTRVGNDPDDFLFYLDGVLLTAEQSGYGNLTVGDLSGSCNDLTIGSFSSVDPFKGMLRQLRIYDRAVDLSELQDNFAAGYNAGPSDDTDLVLHAPLHEGTGTTVTDLSSQEATGTFQGTGLTWVKQQQSLQKIQLFYDPRGQVIRTVNPDNTEQRVLFGIPKNPGNPFPGNGKTTTSHYHATPWESYTYDANDLKPLTHPLEETVPETHEYTPSSSLIDALGRTIQTTDRNGTEEVVMKYVYDIQGNLLEVKDPYQRSVFLHEYDFANRPLKTTHLDGGTKYVVMDCMSRPIEMRDEKGALVLNAYDELNRPTRIWARDKAADATTMRQKMIYGDSAGLSDPEEDNLKGKLYKQYDEAGLTTIEAYDFKGQVPEKIRELIKDEALLSVFDGPPVDWQVEAYRVNWQEDEELNEDLLEDKAYVTSMEYDALGRVTKMTYPEDADSERKELTTVYNRSGALESVSLDGNVYVDRIAYNAKGQKILTAFGNGMMTRYLYRNDNFRLLRMKTEGYEKNISGEVISYVKQSGTTKQNFFYEYDLSGNIISITDTTPGCGVAGTDELVRTFEYDALYRLLSATGRETAATASLPWEDVYRPNDNSVSRGYTQYYEYDKLGNIQELQHVASGGNFTREFNYVSGKNKLDTIEVGMTSYSFDHDVNGNIVQEDTSRHFAYDYADRLKAFYVQATTEEPSQYAQYFYDAGGNRVKKLVRTAGGDYVATTYIDGIFEYTYDSDSTEEQNILHVMDGSSRIATLRVGNDMGDTTPAVKYNLEDHLGSSNLLLSTDGTLVSMEEYYPFGETSFGSYGKKSYRFCGKEKDEESGLYYYGLRYYNPWTCRFMNIDPLASKYPFYTPYQYAGNKPINFIDLDGAEEAPAKSESEGGPGDGNIGQGGDPGHEEQGFIGPQQPSNQSGNDNLVIDTPLNSDGTFEMPDFACNDDDCVTPGEPTKYDNSKGLNAPNENSKPIIKKTVITQTALTGTRKTEVKTYTDNPPFNSEYIAPEKKEEEEKKKKEESDIYGFLGIKKEKQVEVKDLPNHEVGSGEFYNASDNIVNKNDPDLTSALLKVANYLKNHPDDYVQIRAGTPRAKGRIITLGEYAGRPIERLLEGRVNTIVELLIDKYKVNPNQIKKGEHIYYSNGRPFQVNVMSSKLGVRLN